MVRPGIKTVGPSRWRARESYRLRGIGGDSWMSSQGHTGPRMLGLGPAAAQSRVVLVGARRDARRLIRSLGKKPWSGLPIVGFVDAGHARSSSLSAAEPPSGSPSSDRSHSRPGRHRSPRRAGRPRPRHPRRRGRLGTARHSGTAALTQLSNSDVAVHWVLVDSGRLDLATISPSAPRIRGRGQLSSRTLMRKPSCGCPVWDRLRMGSPARNEFSIPRLATARA